MQIEGLFLLFLSCLEKFLILTFDFFGKEDFDKSVKKKSTTIYKRQSIKASGI